MNADEASLIPSHAHRGTSSELIFFSAVFVCLSSCLSSLLQAYCFIMALAPQKEELVEMKTKMSSLKRLVLATGALCWCAFNIHAQTAPTLTNQPTNLSVLGGGTATFSVGASGTGPISYQWQFNGTNLENQNIIITTVAGNGTATFAGDGEPATNASLNSPYGVIVDIAGNIYVADSANNRIRRVNTSGIITTVAGTNSAGSTGDGGPAINAGLNNPEGLALDAFSNLYIADTGNSRIRKVDTNGIITTVAGGGTGGDGGAATNASLHNPTGVALDMSGNLYIADYSSFRVRMVKTNNIITTVVGNGTLGFSGDGGAATNAHVHNLSDVALDAAGDLYLADSGNYRIRKVDANGIITSVAGNGNSTYSGDNGPALGAGLDQPFGVALDTIGNMYIADYLNNRIRRVDVNGIISTVAGGGSGGDGGAATNAGLSNPSGVALDASANLYIADRAHNRIREVWIYAGNPMLTLSNLSPPMAGNYTVVISNPYGSVTSAVATMTVEAPPAITLQPANQIVEVGSNAVFSAAAVGSGPFGYSWYLAACRT
jgi:sugar lactone lactonase YvrE